MHIHWVAPMHGRTLFLFFALLLPTVLAQTSHTVTVGVEGSFYTPPTLSAGLNDTVTFEFGGDFHTVTQSSFESPCIRLDGGFDSGFNGRGANFSLPVATWTLRITNVSEPIWFFCQASMPSSHCEAGMVGAINPPSIAMYQQFVSAAKLVTSTPKPSPSFIASGQGAFATNSPMPSSIPNLQSSAPFSVSDSSTPTPTPTTTASPDSISTTPAAAPGRSGINHGLIAGCATAGGIVILLLITFVLYRCRRHRPTPMLTPTPIHGMYKEKSPGLTSADTTTHMFPAIGTGTGTPATAVLYRDRDRERDHGDDAEKRTDTGTDTDGQPGSSPHLGTGVRPLPRTPAHSQMQQNGFEDDPTPAAHVDINALAMEVASVLLHTPPRQGSRQHLDSVRNNASANADANADANTQGAGRHHPGHGQRHKLRAGSESGWYEEGSSEETSPSAPPYYGAS